jgi:hypothetical protein
VQLFKQLNILFFAAACEQGGAQEICNGFNQTWGDYIIMGVGPLRHPMIHPLHGHPFWRDASIFTNIILEGICNALIRNSPREGRASMAGHRIDM